MNSIENKKKSVYAAPHMTRVAFRIEAGYSGSSQTPEIPVHARVDNATWESDETFNNATSGTYFER